MRLRIIENFLTQEQCNQFIELAKNRLQKSLAWDVATGSSKEDAYRNSEQTFFSLGENELVREIEQKIESITGVPVENGEGLQLVHYYAGGFYKPHWDYFDYAYEPNANALNRGGQRIITFLIYLNDNNAGTYFPIHDLMIKPKAGRAIVWLNVNNSRDGKDIDNSTYHEGVAVPQNESKWILTKWLHESRFT